MSEKKIIENPEEFHIQPCDIGNASFDVYNDAFGGDEIRGTGAWALMRFYRGRHAGSDSWNAFKDSVFCEWAQWTIGIIAAVETLIDEGYLVRDPGANGICRMTEELVELCFAASHRSES